MKEQDVGVEKRDEIMEAVFVVVVNDVDDVIKQFAVVVVEEVNEK